VAKNRILVSAAGFYAVGFQMFAQQQKQKSNEDYDIQK
jgi:hypothetical protein